jgi:hypothetical protein
MATQGYSVGIELLDAEGGAQTTNVVVRSWELLKSPNTGSSHTELDRETVSIWTDESAAVAIEWASGPAPTSHVFDGVGLSVQDAALAGPAQNLNHVPDAGWLFRSGWFATGTLPTSGTPPVGHIEIITGTLTLVDADLPALLPALDPNNPITFRTIGDQFELPSVVTQINARFLGADGTQLSGSLEMDVVVDTTLGEIDPTTGNPEVATNRTADPFNVLLPSTEMVVPAQEAITTGLLTRADFASTTAFESAGSFNPVFEAQRLTGAEQTAVGQSVVDLIRGTFVPMFCRNVEVRLAQKIAAGVLRDLGSGGLPAGVILSVRKIEISAGQMVVHGALGAFGGVMSKLPPAPDLGGGSSGSSSCAATSVLAVQALGALRAVRDETLAATDVGRWATDAYYRSAAEVCALFERNPWLAARAAVLGEDVASELRAGGSIGEALHDRCERFLRDLARFGSPELRATLAEARNAGVLRLV